mmetsp:Transcript_24757/g.44628  ORF Transcript_24757/g.44628 Transcript_24757/m.44628 type:complete len:103 (-) Transcript_24757:12-320(-)
MDGARLDRLVWKVGMSMDGSLPLLVLVLVLNDLDLDDSIIWEGENEEESMTMILLVLLVDSNDNGDDEFLEDNRPRGRRMCFAKADRIAIIVCIYVFRVLFR